MTTTSLDTYSYFTAAHGKWDMQAGKQLMESLSKAFGRKYNKHHEYHGLSF